MSLRTCIRCDGEGTVARDEVDGKEYPYSTLLGQRVLPYQCPVCKGTGQINLEGTGWSRKLI